MSPPDIPSSFRPLPLPQPVKIAFAGPMASGKTTLANLLCERHPGLCFQRTSFAERLKELARELFGMQSKDRELLIHLGRNLRDIDADVFVNSVICRVHSARRNDARARNWILDDLRFRNEYDALRRDGWHIIRLRASEDVRVERLQLLYSPEEAEIHARNLRDASETNLGALSDSMFDCVLYTDDDSGQEENADKISLMLQLQEAEMRVACEDETARYPGMVVGIAFSTAIALLYAIMHFNRLA